MMSGQVSAEIGRWYRFTNRMNSFEVVAIDFNEQSVEVQCFDGSIEQIEFNLWKATCSTQISPPEDWSGPYASERDDQPFNDYAVNEALSLLDRAS